MTATAPRVALLTQWYPPEPALQPRWIVEALRAAGWDCHVVTGVPNYPSGEVAPGYRAWRRSREVVDGVEVRRTPLFPDHGTGAVKRFLNYASWALSSSLLARRDLRRDDVVLVYSSPATAATAAMLAERVHGVPYVLFIQDLWPDTVTQSGMLPARLHAVVDRVLTAFVDRSYRRAAAIAVISPGMRRLLVERGVPAEKVTLVYNWVPERHDDAATTTSLRASLGLHPDDFVLMYAGNHGAAQGLGPVVESFLGAGPGRHLALIGSGIEKPRLQAQVADLGLGTRVHFVEPQPSATVRAWMHEADAQLVSLTEQPLFAVTMPSKLQAALAEGRPVLAVATGDVADVVTDAGAGLTVRPGEVAAIRDAVEQMARAPQERRASWGANARGFYEASMQADIGAGRLTQILRSAARRRHRPAS